jgi:hypothetical protein
MGLSCLKRMGLAMTNILIRLKPGVRRETHLLLAASLWTAIGVFLLLRASHWLWPGRLVYYLPAFLLGTLKSLFFLDKAAGKSIQRILLLTDGTCLGAVYSIKTWMLVLLMMGTGMALRRSSLPPALLGTVYGTIGWALIYSSRHAWRAWGARGKIKNTGSEAL